MNLIKSFSRRSLFWLLFFMLLLVAIIDIAVYFGANYLFSIISWTEIQAAINRSPELQGDFERIMPILEWIRTLFLPVSIGLFIFFALIQWLVVRGIFVRALRRAGVELKEGAPIEKKRVKKKQERSTEKKETPGMDKKELQETHRRYYLHLISVLQREGRLIDFLEEDLAPYDDSQIGAAVRSIHENCKKTLQKYLSPKTVMEDREGDQVNVPADFDPASIKLTGDVSGEPPFTGILRHKGWRAGKLELPVLSATGDSRIIAPAEVEIE